MLSFNPRTPCGVRLQTGTTPCGICSFQSTHSLRSATKKGAFFAAVVHVSIHALLAECDTVYARVIHAQWVSIHALLAECDLLEPSERPRIAGFQSTHSLRSATTGWNVEIIQEGVSIHALLAECDRYIHHPGRARQKFQSTHSLRSATGVAGPGPSHRRVSIHALLAECDLGRFQEGKEELCFNPRTPCGVRPFAMPIFVSTRRFQSTHSLRSATRQRRPRGRMAPVSIHALLAECDFLEGMNCKSSLRFQSTHSLRSATSQSRPPWRPVFVSIHALLAECDGQSSCPGNTRDRFQSTHSLRSATSTLQQAEAATQVSIHALLAECDQLPPAGNNPGRRFNPRTPCGVRPSFPSR